MYWVGGGCHPNFIQKLCFAYFCRLSVRALGRPTRLNPTVPRLRLQFWVFENVIKRKKNHGEVTRFCHFFLFLFFGQLSPSSAARCDRRVLMFAIRLSFIEN